MSYTLPQKQAAARALVAQVPGIRYTTALCWVTCEQGDNFNFLGLTGPSGLLKFADFTSAAKAYAIVIAKSPLYAGLREAFKVNISLVQLRAVARCPWHLGEAGLARAGGVDPYYRRIFADMGYRV